MAKPRTKENLLYGEEFNLLINSCKTYEEKLIINLLLFTGMRISEAIHLSKEWIDWNGNLIKIPESMKCPCYECKKEIKIKKSKNPLNIGKIKKPSGVWMPKTKSGIRAIPILPEIKGILKEYFDKNNSIRDLISDRIKAWNLVKIVGKRSKLEKKIFPHCLRGTFATKLMAKGFDYLTITNVMGWNDIKVVMSYAKYSGDSINNEFKEKW